MAPVPAAAPTDRAADGWRHGRSIEEALQAAGLPPLPRSAWLEIDLDRLAGNLAVIRAAVPGGVRVEPVVKSDAYGHGAVPVAAALAAAGADGVCVATLDEGIELRRGGLRLPILVLYAPPPDLAPEAARRDLAVAAGDLETLRRTLAAVAAARSTGRPPRRRLRIHLEVETGLGRAGVAIVDVPAAARAIRATAGAALVGVWSHLGSPDDEVRSAFQTTRFTAALDVLRAVHSGAPARHFAASGGLLAASAPPYDSVRPGLATYGVVPDGLIVGERLLSMAAGLRPVLSLHARPVRVAELPAGTGISYGGGFVTARPSRIATLPVGYGDGFARALSNRSVALVRGRPVPLVGTVAMDAVMADVTDVPGPPVTIDDEFVLLGEQADGSIAAEETARWRTTISWEVLASMARRLPRVYHSARGPVGLRTLTDEKGTWRASSSGTGTSATSRSTRS